MAEEVIQNNSVTFDITPYLTDRGWRYLAPTLIRHELPNSGDLVINSFNVTEGTTYEYSFNITNLSSGSITLSLGGVTEDPVITNGYVQGTIVAETTEPMTFFSNGNLTLSNVNVTARVSEEEDVDG